MEMQRYCVQHMRKSQKKLESWMRKETQVPRIASLEIDFELL
jgi:hypothetical protein